jgi:hypothetical protein
MENYIIENLKNEFFFEKIIMIRFVIVEIDPGLQ